MLCSYLLSFLFVWYFLTLILSSGSQKEAARIKGVKGPYRLTDTFRHISFVCLVLGDVLRRAYYSPPKGVSHCALFVPPYFSSSCGIF